MTAVLLSAMAGCHTTTFEMTTPVAAVITPDRPFHLAVDPLRFEFFTADDHLGVKIFNPTAETIKLLGPESSAVDQQGNSHPLISQTIAGNSFIKMILPPPRPWGSGGAVRIGLIPVDTPGARYGYPDDGPPQPQEMLPDPYNAPVYWDWSDNTVAVHLHFVFERDKSTFGQSFVIQRVDR